MPAPLRCPTCSGPLDIPPEHATVTRCTYCGAGVLLTERSGRVHAAAQQEQHADAIAEVLAWLRAGDRLAAIKAYRERFGVGLAEGQYAVERLEAGQLGGAPAAASFGASAVDAPEEVLRHLRAGNKIAAIKAYRDIHGGGLTEAVAAVERIAAAQPPGTLPPPPSTRGLRAFTAGLAVLSIATFIYFGQRDAAPAPDPAQPAPVERLAPASPVAREPAGPPPFAEPVMRFGSEGTGAGRFEDARSVAVDGTGRIYVAEYSGGRVQAFDSAGTFLTQWMADTRTPVLDVEVDRGGTVYVVQSGRVRRFEGATGRALEDLPRPRGTGVNDLAIALDGTLWAVVDRDQVMHLDRNGRVLQTIDATEAIDADASPARVAVAGTGDLYMVDTWTGVIYHLGPDGRFRNRFGGRGDGPGTMSAPQDVVVDGRGRVYASDMMGGVHVFESDGRFIGEFADAGIFGIAFNDRDELFASHRNDAEIVKYRLNR